MPLTDNSPMPFGRYKGKALVNVPASYLLVIYRQGIHPLYNDVKAYIEENMTVLQAEEMKANSVYQKWARLNQQ